MCQGVQDASRPPFLRKYPSPPLSPCWARRLPLGLLGLRLGHFLGRWSLRVQTEATCPSKETTERDWRESSGELASETACSLEGAGSEGVLAFDDSWPLIRVFNIKPKILQFFSKCVRCCPVFCEASSFAFFGEL